MLGETGDRARVIKAGDGVDYDLWAPDEVRTRAGNVTLFLEDQALDEACKLHAKLMSMKDSYAAGRKVLRDVAKALNDFHWTSVIDTSEDFIVAAVDNTGHRDPKKDIKGCIPAERFTALRKAGLI